MAKSEYRIIFYDQDGLLFEDSDYAKKGELGNLADGLLSELPSDLTEIDNSTRKFANSSEYIRQFNLENGTNVSSNVFMAIRTPHGHNIPVLFEDFYKSAMFDGTEKTFDSIKQKFSNDAPRYVSYCMENPEYLKSSYSLLKSQGYLERFPAANYEMYNSFLENSEKRYRSMRDVCVAMYLIDCGYIENVMSNSSYRRREQGR